MTTATLKKNIVKTVQKLSPSRLKVALEFLGYLKERDAEWEATTEILNDKKLLRAVKAGQRDADSKKLSDFSPWRAIKRYV